MSSGNTSSYSSLSDSDSEVCDEALRDKLLRLQQAMGPGDTCNYFEMFLPELTEGPPAAPQQHIDYKCAAAPSNLAG